MPNRKTQKTVQKTKTSQAAAGGTTKEWVAKAVVFDFDGTLTTHGSTRSTWEAIWEHLEYGPNECGSLAERFYKKDHPHHITHPEWCRLTLEKFMARKLNYDGVVSVASGLSLITDFDECMKELQRLGIPIYLVSGSIWDVIAAALGDRIQYFRRIEANAFGYFGPNRLLGNITGTKFDFEGKGDFVREVAKELHVRTSDILFVGNSNNDTHVKAVGARTLLVNPHGTTVAEDQGRAWDEWLPHMDSLLQILPFVDSGWEKRQKIAAQEKWQQAQSVLQNMNELRLRAYSVHGNYRRFSNEERPKLIALADRIRRPLNEKSNTRENFLIYASPGSGKTFFIEELAKTLVSMITFVPIDLSRDDRAECERKLATVAAAKLPCLCMIDEVDGRKGDEWPCEIMYKTLDLNVKPDRQPVVVVLIGSSGGTVGKLAETFEQRTKGKDFIDRVPKGHYAEIPPMGPGDTVCVYASKILEAAKTQGKPIQYVAKIAAYYAVLTCNTPRQISMLADEAVRRVPNSHTQVHYDNHFEAGDKSNRDFLDQHSEVAAAFGNQTFRIGE